MTWHGTLDLDYSLDPHHTGRTVGRGRHVGPLRVLASLYPEGPGVCHHVLVHPPGGIVGGDVLEMRARVGTGSHALITTPGATRFYRSTGATATQSLDAELADGARLEWLPLETIVHRGAIGANRLRFSLAPGAQMIGWDMLALGLPAAGEMFDRGRYEQQIELPGAWLDRAVLDTEDDSTRRLLHSPLGWDGHAVLATMWLAGGSDIAPAQRQALLDAARESLAADEDDGTTHAGVTSPDARVVVLRLLAHRTEPALQRLTAVWTAWRRVLWDLPAPRPRIWRT